jgi:hypothetical protein
MRYTFLNFCALGLMALALSCCDSDGVGPGVPDSDFYIRFKLDGQEKEFKARTQAVFHYDEDKLTYHADMTAGLSGNVGVDAVTIFMYNDESYGSGID